MTGYRLLMLALALIAGSSGYIAHQLTSHAQQPPVNGVSSPLPDAAAAGSNPEPGALFSNSFSDLEGVQRRLAEWRAPVLVINFWATWCPPCLREIPALNRLQARYVDKGVRFLGIALDQRAAVQDFLRTHEMTYPVLFGDEAVAQLMVKLGNTVGGLPFTVIVDEQGQALFAHAGEVSEKQLEAALVEIVSTQ